MSSCKCAKCYKQIKDEEQVHYEKSIYCQCCCEKEKRETWWILGGFFAFAVMVIFVVLWISSKQAKEDD